MFATMYCSSTTAKNIICNVWQPQILGLHIIWSVSGLAAKQYTHVAAMFQSCTYLQCRFNVVYPSVTYWSSATETVWTSKVTVLWGCDGAKPLVHVPSMLLLYGGKNDYAKYLPTCIFAAGWLWGVLRCPGQLPGVLWHLRQFQVVFTDSPPHTWEHFY